MSDASSTGRKKKAKKDEKKDADLGVSADDSLGLGPDQEAESSGAEDTDDPVKNAIYKEQILKWVVEADFSKEISLTEIARHKFKLEQDEATELINNEGIFKIIKV